MSSSTLQKATDQLDKLLHSSSMAMEQLNRISAPVSNIHKATEYIDKFLHNSKPQTVMKKLDGEKDNGDD